MADTQGWETTGDGQLPLAEIVVLGPELVVDSSALERRQSVPLTNVMQLDKPMRRISKIIAAARYWRGDLLLLAETLFAEEAAQIVDAEHLTEAEANAERLVAKSVKPTTRAHAQSWDHALAVVKLSDEEQVAYLDKARADNWSARKLAQVIAQDKAGPGKTIMRFWLIVEAKTEAARDKMAERLKAEGFAVKTQEKLTKVKKPKKAKKGPVTAKKRQGSAKMNRTKRVPK